MQCARVQHPRTLNRRTADVGDASDKLYLGRRVAVVACDGHNPSVVVNFAVSVHADCKHKCEACVVSMSGGGRRGRPHSDSVVCMRPRRYSSHPVYTLYITMRGVGSCTEHEGRAGTFRKSNVNKPGSQPLHYRSSRCVSPGRMRQSKARLNASSS
jgi:hypothetical protein